MTGTTAPTLTRRVRLAFAGRAQLVLCDETDRYRPPIVAIDGLAQWVRALAEQTVDATLDRGALTVHAVAAYAWGDRALDVPHEAMTARFRRAGLAPPKRWIIAYRAAAIGVLYAEGLDATTTASLLGLASSKEIYRQIGYAERALGRAAVAKSTLYHARRRPARYLFWMYVAPLFPARDARAWDVPLIPSQEQAP